ETTINIPVFMQGIQKDISHRKGAFYQYQLSGYFKPYFPTKTYHQINKTPKMFLESLFYTYQKDEKEKYLNFARSKVKKEIKSLSDADFQKEWEAISLIKTPKVFYFYKKDNGFLVSWGEEGLKARRALYIKKEKGTFKLFPLH